MTDEAETTETSEETNGVTEEVVRGGIISATETTVGVPEDERAKILEEVRKLTKANGDPPDPPKAKAKKKEDPPPPEPEEEEETELSKLLREREDRAPQDKVAPKSDDDFGKRMQSLVSAEAATLQKQRELDEQLARFKLLRENPGAGLRALGVDPMQWAQQLAGEVKPDNPEMAALRGELAEIKKQLGGVAQKSTELETYKSAVQEQLQSFQLQRENENLFKALEAEKADKEVKYAYLGNTDAIVARARSLAGLYIEKTGKNSCEYPMLVKQLRSEASKKLQELAKDDDFYELLTSYRQKAGGTSGKATPGKKPAASPSARAASERRATPKPIDEMTGDEQVEVMRQAARDAAQGMSKPS